MVELTSLWLPILLSGLFVFIVSSVIHMFLGYHANDFKKLPSEDDVMRTLRPHDIPPGDYCVPFAGSNKELKSQAFKDKVSKGPVAFMTVLPNGTFSMGGSLSMWFVYLLIVSLFAGYIGSRAVPMGGHYLEVFRFVGCSAFMGYSLALMQNSIWYKKSWAATLKSMFDGFIYALITAGTFGWLWPKGM